MRQVLAVGIIVKRNGLEAGMVRTATTTDTRVRAGNQERIVHHAKNKPVTIKNTEALLPKPKG